MTSLSGHKTPSFGKTAAGPGVEGAIGVAAGGATGETPGGGNAPGGAANPGGAKGGNVGGGANGLSVSARYRSSHAERTGRMVVACREI